MLLRCVLEVNSFAKYKDGLVDYMGNDQNS